MTVPFRISESYAIAASPSLLGYLLVSRSAAARESPKERRFTPSGKRPSSTAGSGVPAIERQSPCYATSARRVQGRRHQRLARQRYALIDGETDQRQHREQDRDHQRANRAVIIHHAGGRAADRGAMYSNASHSPGTMLLHCTIIRLE